MKRLFRTLIELRFYSLEFTSNWITLIFLMTSLLITRWKDFTRTWWYLQERRFYKWEDLQVRKSSADMVQKVRTIMRTIMKATMKSDGMMKRWGWQFYRGRKFNWLYTRRLDGQYTNIINTKDYQHNQHIDSTIILQQSTFECSTTPVGCFHCAGRLARGWMRSRRSS